MSINKPASSEPIKMEVDGAAKIPAADKPPTITARPRRLNPVRGWKEGLVGSAKAHHLQSSLPQLTTVFFAGD